MSHHHQRHVKGGFDFDTNTIPPNGIYWLNSAIDAYERLESVIGEEKAGEMVENITGTWREIYDRILILAKLAEQQKEDRKIHQTKDVVDVQANPEWSASVRKHRAF